MKNRLPQRVRKTLDDTGFDWWVEEGTNHFKIKLAGHMVSIWPKGRISSKDQHGEKNTISQVRRLARELERKSA